MVKVTSHFEDESRIASRDSKAARLRVITGQEIPTTLYTQLRRPLNRLFIVTPFLEDYEFFGKGPLSKFLSKQLTEGTKISMLTVPPEGINGTKKAFERKYRLTSLLWSRGVDISFNSKLHAKVFLFDESEVTKATILGSANLTTAAMNVRLEIAIFTHNRGVFNEILSIVRRFEKDSGTMTFAKWRAKAASKIKSIMEVH